MSYWTRYEHMMDDAKILLNSFQSWTVGHVNRNANKASQKLAKEAISRPLDQVWMESTWLTDSWFLRTDVS
jgi:hypothetical protein